LPFLFGSEGGTGGTAEAFGEEAICVIEDVTFGRRRGPAVRNRTGRDRPREAANPGL
jgi:hypothetical protein